MKISRITAFFFALIILMSAFGMGVSADAGKLEAYVTISDGTLAVTAKKITVTDADNDGMMTVNDALFLAHEAEYSGGAAAGYASAKGDYGLAITKLWGISNGSGYGYYVNNVSVSSLAAEIKDGDRINAFVYTDTTGFSDVYCYFNASEISVTAGKTLTLTLSAAAFDENWNPVVKPVADAVILIDGTESGFKTDADGKAVLTFDEAKTTVISAKSASSVLVPPVCVATVSAEAENPKTGDALFLMAALAAFMTALCVVLRRVHA